MIQAIIGSLFNFLSGGIADKALSAYVASKTSDTQVNVEGLRQATELAKLEVEKLRIDSGSLLTRMIRPCFAAPFILYYGKLLVWDKGFGRILQNNGWEPYWFVTDGLSPELVALSGTVVGFYFGADTVRFVASRIWRR